MRVTTTNLSGVLLIEPEVHADERGYFFESFRSTRYNAAGITAEFLQDNISYSARGVVRGLHFQWPNAQGKLVYVLQGEVFDVAVDLRHDSPTFRSWEGHTLSHKNRHQLWIPPGYAHGFAVTGAGALVAYKCTRAYDRECDRTVRWNDPDLRIAWPTADPTLSPKDAAAPLLEAISPEHLPSLES